MRRLDNISIIICVFNEEKTLSILYDKIINVLKHFGLDSEIIFVDDCSTDSSYAVLQNLIYLDKRVKLFRLSSNMGQVKAFEKGFFYAKSEIVITMDSDLQNDPDDIPGLVRKLNEGFDLVCGWRFDREDPWCKILISRIGNFLQRQITGLDIHDISCSLRAYRKSILSDAKFAGRYSIFIVPLILAEKTRKIAEVKIKHYGRPFGRSKYYPLMSSCGAVLNYINFLLKRC